MSSKKTGGRTEKTGQQTSSKKPPRSTENPASLSNGYEGASPEEDTLGLFLKLSPEGKKARFLSVSEAAKRVSKAERTLRAWFNSGRINGHYCGGRIWICRKSLTDYLNREDRRRK